MPKITRPKTRPLYLALDLDVFEELERIVALTGRDYKSEITFALREHFEKGPRLLPPDSSVTKKGGKRHEK